MPPEFWKQYEERHRRNLAAINRAIRKLYEQVIQEISVKINSLTYNGKPFALKDYPVLQKKVESVIKKLHGNLYTTIINGIDTSWNLSNEKNNVFVDKRLVGRKINGKTLKLKARQVLYDPNYNGLQSFKNRTEKGLNLSDRVWNSLGPYKTELEQGLGLAIGSGASSTETATELKQYLNNPDKLFRRVRDDEGKLVLSKAARDYHPGQGVYRSSYKNALRLAGTETNIAYRSSDNQRWEKMPFVIGQIIKLSNAHPRYDMCDPLAGEYPKDFIWNGWHPQCICYHVPKLLTDAEYDKVEDQILKGETISVTAKGTVTKPPRAFDQFIKKNNDRINGWKNKPYWMRDNPDLVKSALSSSGPQPAGRNVAPQLKRVPASIKGSVEKALNLIDLVHGDGDLPNIPFTYTNTDEYEAAFYYHPDTNIATKIDLSTNSTYDEFNIIHEMGHFFDATTLGTVNEWDSIKSSSSVSKVIEVALKSDAIKSLKETARTGKTTIGGVEKTISSALLTDVKEYYLIPEEIWARAYSQFITSRTGDSKLKKALDHNRKNESKVGVPAHWQDDDFSDIETAIEEMMIDVGWMTNP